MITATDGWGAPKTIETRNGRRTLRNRQLTEGDEAFKAWAHDKASVKAARFSLGKAYLDPKKWEICHWENVPGQFQEDLNALNAVIAQAIEGEAAAAKAMAIDYVDDDYDPLTTASAYKLYDWQRPSCQRLINALLVGNALDASQTGAGKTFVALAACAELRLTPYVVAPMAVLEAWRRAALFMGITLGGVTNYDKARAGSSDFIAKNKGAKRKDGERTFAFQPRAPRSNLFDLAPTDTLKPLLIFDEVQKTKSGGKTLQGQILVDTVMQGAKVLCLSATAAKDPTEMDGIGIALNLHEGGKSYTAWMKKHGCKRGTGGYFFTDNPKAKQEIMQKIHRTIFPRKGTRIRSTDVPGYPENAVTAHLIENTAIITAYKEMQDDLQMIEMKRDRAEIDKRQAAASGLAAIMKARRASEIGKLDFIIEETKELLADGFQVVVFLNFREHLAIVRDGLKLKYDPIWGTAWLGKEQRLNDWGKMQWFDIDGRAQKPEERQILIDDFQSGKNKVELVSLQAGGAGISLHDDQGFAPRQSIVSPSYSVIDLIQSLGRVWRAGSHSKATQRIIFAAGTIEEEIAASIQSKCENIERLNDGDLMPESVAKVLDRVSE